MRIFLLCILLITGIETGVYWHYDSLLKGSATTVSGNENKTNGLINNEKNSGSKNEILAANENVNQIAVSDNHQLAAYVNDKNELHIVNLSNQSELYSTTGQEKIIYLKWIRNDSLFIGVKGDNSTLILKTFQVGSEQERTIETFDGVSSTSTFKSIVYSPFTNDVYILIGNKVRTKMYHINTNGHMAAMQLNHDYIMKPMMLSTKNELFYQDVNDNIWDREDGVTSKFKNNAVPLAVFDDSFYYGLLNDEGRISSVYVYEKGNRQKVEDLPTPVHANNIVVNQDGSLTILKTDSYYNTKTGKSTPLSDNVQAYVDNNTLYIVKNNKTYFVNN
ncbi:hypothetical protein HPT25_19465 [Bacillus sp. BRMEA1]|uniref:hypothetical protein n=1 Tax=Neobacillus endophyticus TaxID=2738405 RepID=UPI001566FBF9|nr:hypothetical protein [Neobacillus endophyticus]NRD79543.1 hypothetical protein [Neobacillus endophyticus]